MKIKKWVQRNEAKVKLAGVVGILVLATGSLIATNLFSYLAGYNNALNLFDGIGQGGGLTGRAELQVISWLGFPNESRGPLTRMNHNTITIAGLNATTENIGKDNMDGFDFVAVGTGTGGDNTSTTLQTQYSTRGAGTYTRDEAQVGNWTINYLFAAGFFGGETITETGVFNASTGGTLLNYQDGFSKGPLSASDSLNVTFYFNIADAQWGASSAKWLEVDSMENSMVTMKAKKPKPPIEPPPLVPLPEYPVIPIDPIDWLGWV